MENNDDKTEKLRLIYVNLEAEHKVLKKLYKEKKEEVYDLMEKSEKDIMYSGRFYRRAEAFDILQDEMINLQDKIKIAANEYEESLKDAYPYIEKKEPFLEKVEAHKELDTKKLMLLIKQMQSIMNSTEASMFEYKINEYMYHNHADYSKIADRDVFNSVNKDKVSFEDRLEMFMSEPKNDLNKLEEQINGMLLIQMEILKLEFESNKDTDIKVKYNLLKNIKENGIEALYAGKKEGSGREPK